MHPRRKHRPILAQACEGGHRRERWALGQFASPYLLSPRLAAEPLSSNSNVASGPASHSTYVQLSPRLVALPSARTATYASGLPTRSRVAIRAEGVARGEG